MKVAVTTLAICVTSLLALGLVMLYSSSMVMLDKHHNEIGTRMLLMQSIWCLPAIAICIVLAAVDYEILKRLAWPAFVVALLLAALVFVPHVGLNINGSRRWIRLPGATFQPSEMIKIALILVLAWQGDRSVRTMNTFVRGMIYPGMVILTAVAFVIKEPDFGTSVLLVGVGGVMLFLAGTRWWHLLPPALLGAGGMAWYLKHDSMRGGRIAAWLHPELYPDLARQAEQAKVAIGSGGLTGLGLGDGRQKLGFLPEIHSDFIFANIGEELGLLATALLVLAFVLIAFCGIFIALRARDRFGCLLAVGVTTLITLQALFNMYVVTSLLPNKGIALPFISAGGSSLVAMFAGVGILFSVARQATPAKISASDFVSKSNDNPFAAKAT